MLSPVGPLIANHSMWRWSWRQTLDTGGNLGKYPHGEEFSRSSVREVFDK